MRRAARAHALLAAAVSQARWQSTGNQSGAEPKAEAQAVPAATPQSPPPSNSAEKGSAGGDYRFPTTEVLDAVKKRDFTAVQTHASKLVQSQWREAYNVPAACVVVFLVMWYWIAWSRRSIRRKCAALTASTKQQTEEMVETVRGMTEKWKSDMAKANQQMQGIIDKNSALTGDIDRMTTALRACSIRPTPATAAVLTPTVTVVRRNTAEAEPAAAAESQESADAPAAEKADSQE